MDPTTERLPEHPDEETLLDLAEGRVDEGPRRLLLEHLDGCAECRQLVSELAREVVPELPPETPSALKRAQALLAQGVPLVAERLPEVARRLPLSDWREHVELAGVTVGSALVTWAVLHVLAAAWPR